MSLVPPAGEREERGRGRESLRGKVRGREGKEETEVRGERDYSEGGKGEGGKKEREGAIRVRNGM